MSYEQSLYKVIEPVKINTIKRLNVLVNIKLNSKRIQHIDKTHQFFQKGEFIESSM